MKYTAKLVIEKFLDFYKSKGHVQIENANLVPQNDPTLLFINSGMAPIKRVFTGEAAPIAHKMCNVQTCIRTNDIEDVGDDSHLTVFHMLGDWYINGYSNPDVIKTAYEFLTKRLKIDKNKLYVSIFEGDKKRGIKADEESAGSWVDCGIDKSHIVYLPFEDNFWRMGEGESPCGPCTEVFYDKETEGVKAYVPGGKFDDKKRYVEIWNAGVFMQYFQTIDGKYIPLKMKSVDAGAGVERLLSTLNGKKSVYETEIFVPVLEYLKQNSTGYNERSARITADHVRAATYILNSGAEPSNVRAGYVLRNLIRRSLRHLRKIGFEDSKFTTLVDVTIKNMTVTGLAPNWSVQPQDIIAKFKLEQDKFGASLKLGLKVFEEAIQDKNSFEGKNLKPQIAFRLYDTYGFPIEITKELLKENGFTTDEKTFNALLDDHRELSKGGSDAVFKSGLSDTDPKTIALHTATHLLHASLKHVLGAHVSQKGSNITPERLRFDFNFERKLLPEELTAVESFVNDAIKRKLTVTCEHMTPALAKSRGAIGLFDSKYGDDITVYQMGDVSLEICAGPHVKNTGELGKFKISKEEASSAGVRRIKAILI